MRGRDQFNKYKGIIDSLVIVYGKLPRVMRERLLLSKRMSTGKIALVNRYVLVKTLAKSVGDNVAVFSNVYLKNTQNLTIGNNVSIHPMCYIEALGGIQIGNDVSIAEGTSIFSVNHRFDELEVPIKDQGVIELPIVIEDNVWIGSKATILGGVTIAEGTIVAAGAVVTKSTLPYTTVGGVPAKIIKYRGNDNALICSRS